METPRSERKSMFSYGVTVLLSLLIGYLTFFKGPERILTYDVFGYYLYLPATFKYDDPGIENRKWLDNLFEEYHISSTFYQAHKLSTGRHVIQYTSGMAFLMAPFYFIADCLAEPLGYEADGLSPPYHFAIKVGGLIYLVMGLFFLRSVLRRLYPDRIAALSISIVVLGTNYLIYAYGSSMVQHIPLFALYSILIWLTQKWHKNNGRGTLLLIACTCGLMTLIRPTDGLSLLIPLLWNVRNWQEFKDKIAFLFKNHRADLVLFFIVLISWGIPQFIYWTYTSGSPFFVSYQNPAEGLEPWHPWILNVMFSFENGWLIYSPLMILGFIGFVALYKHQRSIFWSVFIFSILNLWLVSSWSYWTYAGGFGHRALIQSYPVWAISIGGCLYWIFKYGKTWIRWSSSFLIVLLLVLCAFQQWQFTKGIIPRNRMTAAYYFAVFGRTNVAEEDRELLLVKREFDGEEIFEEEENYERTILYANDYEEELLAGEGRTIVRLDDGNRVLKLDSSARFSDGIQLRYSEITEKDHAWIRTEAMVFLPHNASAEDLMIVSTFDHKGKGYKYTAKSLDPDSAQFGEWQKLHLDYLTPRPRSLNDKLKVYLWYRGNEEILVDNLRIMKYVEKQKKDS